MEDHETHLVTVCQTIEATFRITTKKLSEEDLRQEHCIGDVMYPITNVLYRIYAQASRPQRLPT
jgi:hypothetical protein